MRGKAAGRKTFHDFSEGCITRCTHRTRHKSMFALNINTQVHALHQRAHYCRGVSPAERTGHATHEHLVAAVTAEDVSTSVLVITLYVFSPTDPASPLQIIIERVLDTTVLSQVKSIFLAQNCDGAHSLFGNTVA